MGGLRVDAVAAHQARRHLLPLTRAQKCVSIFIVCKGKCNGRKVRIVADVVGAVAVQSIANLCRRRPTQVTREESTRPGAEVAGRFVGFDRRHVFSRCARKDRMVSDKTHSKVSQVSLSNLDSKVCCGHFREPFSGVTMLLGGVDTGIVGNLIDRCSAVSAVSRDSAMLSHPG